MLSREASAEPGRWRTARVEPMRAIMDAFHEPGVREIVLQKGTQVGYTEFLLNVLGYHIDLDPCPILWLLPDQKAVEEMSKNRLAPMLRDTPRLAGKVLPSRSRNSDNTIAGKNFPGGRLAIVGSHAPNDISSRPIRLVICDETDRYTLSAGVDGDPMALAGKRQEWFWNARTIKGASPTTKQRSVISREYKKSDMRECWVACPYCSARQVLRWRQVKWDKVTDDNGKTVEHKPETAAYQCEECGKLWDDNDRYDALGNKPEWRASAPFKGIAGFHFPQFYSTVVRLEKVVTEFLTAWGKLPGTVPSTELQKVFVNTVLAETWDEEGETVDASAISKRGELYGPTDLPDKILMLTAGVDVQADRLEVQLIGWGVGEETWVVSYLIIDGDPAQKDVWDKLDRALREKYQTTSGRLLRVYAACIDTGGHHAAEVYSFCKGKRARRIFPIKGKAGPERIWPGRSSRAKDNNRVFMVGVDTAKAQIYARLRLAPRTNADDIDRAYPGFIHFPAPDEDAGTGNVNDDYYRQLTSERQVTRYKNGKPYHVWDKAKDARNEALDTMVYALAARHAANVKLVSRAPIETAAAADADDDEVMDPVTGELTPATRDADDGDTMVRQKPVETRPPPPTHAPGRAPRRSNWLSRGTGRGGWLR